MKEQTLLTQQTSFDQSKLTFRTFSNQQQLDWMMAIIRAELAEPYSIFTYNYFLTAFPEHTIMVYHGEDIIGCIIAKCEKRKAYIAMLVVESKYRRHKIGRKLFEEYLRRAEGQIDKVVLETECVNTTALKFYQSLGFIRTRRMLNYYMSGNDAFRLKLFIKKQEMTKEFGNQIVSSDDEY